MFRNFSSLRIPAVKTLWLVQKCFVYTSRQCSWHVSSNPNSKQGQQRWDLAKTRYENTWTNSVSIFHCVTKYVTTISSKKKKSYRLPSRWTRAKWTQIKHTTMRKAKVLQHISILEVPVCCFLTSFPRSETSLGFLSTSERCRVAPESSALTAILNKETSAQQPLSSTSEREVLGLGKILKSCSWPKRSLVKQNKQRRVFAVSVRSTRQDVCYLKVRDKTHSKLRISFSSMSSRTGILPRVEISYTTTKWPMEREKKEGRFSFPPFLLSPRWWCGNRFKFSETCGRTNL